MKNLITSILLAVALAGNGCAAFKILTKDATPEQKVTAELVGATLKGGVNGVVAGIVAKNPTAKGWFQAADLAVCNLAKGEDMSPAAFDKALASAGQPPSLEVSIGVGLISGLYQAAYAKRAQATVDEHLYAKTLLTAVCDGIKLAVGSP